jgi:hypothetical protein
MSAAANNRNKVRQVDEYLKYIVKNHGGNVKNYKLINNSQALRKVIKMNNISKISNEEKLAKIYPFMRPNFFDPNTLKAMTKKKSILRHVGGFLGGLGGVGKGVVKGALGAVTGGAVGLVSGVAAGATIGAGKGGNALKLGGHEVLKRSGHKNISNAMKRGNINYIFNKQFIYIYVY